MSVPPPDPPPAPQAETCPNCGMPWTAGATVCPNCGFLRPVAAPAWPPPPAGLAAAPLPPVSKLVTKSATGDVLLGLGLSLLTFFLGVGIVVAPVLYFALRRQYPDFGRGLGFGWLVGAALLLGALAVCVIALTQSGQNGH